MAASQDHDINLILRRQAQTGVVGFEVGDGGGGVKHPRLNFEKHLPPLGA